MLPVGGDVGFLYLLPANELAKPHREFRPRLRGGFLALGGQGGRAFLNPCATMVSATVAARATSACASRTSRSVSTLRLVQLASSSSANAGKRCRRKERQHCENAASLHHGIRPSVMRHRGREARRTDIITMNRPESEGPGVARGARTSGGTVSGGFVVGDTTSGSFQLETATLAFSLEGSGLSAISSRAGASAFSLKRSGLSAISSRIRPWLSACDSIFS